MTDFTPEPTRYARELAAAPAAPIDVAHVAYLRKLIVQLAPVALAFLLVLKTAVDSGAGIGGVTIWQALLAAAGALATWRPADARVKLLLSLLTAVSSGVVAVLTGPFTAGEFWLLAVQLVAWAAAGAVPNGPKPSTLTLAA